MHFVGISDRFISIHSPDANNFTIISALWQRFDEVCSKVANPVDNRCYGVICAPAEPSRPDEFCYTAALRVPSPAPPDEGFATHSTSAGLQAVFEHKGPVAGLGTTLRDFLQWLERSDYTQGAGAEIEAYPEEYDPTGSDSIMETWIPIVPRD